MNYARRVPYISGASIILTLLFLVFPAPNTKADTIENQLICKSVGENAPVPLVNDRKTAQRIHAAILASIYPGLLPAKHVYTIVSDAGSFWQVRQELIFKDNNKITSRSGTGISMDIDKCNGAIINLVYVR